MKHLIIYVPGLGDTRDFWQRAALGCWRIFNVKTQFVPMKWYEGGTYETKLQRVLDAIDGAKTQGYTISLVGTSAGASMVLNAAAKRKGVVYRIVTISGANDPFAEISSVTVRKSPSFETSLRTLAISYETLDRSTIDTVRGLNDKIVASRHTLIAGARNHIVPSFGHLLTIAACLTVYSGYIVWLAKRK